MNDWKKWRGGEQPISNGVHFQYMIAAGEGTSNCASLFAKKGQWQHTNADPDLHIIAYRVK